MFDFELSSTGDLIFENETRSNSKFNLSFNVSRKSALRLSFYCKGGEPFKRNKNSLSIMFMIGKEKDKQQAKIIYDAAAKIQFLKNSFQTKKGELPFRKSFGSNLEDFKHKELYDKEIIMNLEKEVYNIVKDMFTNPMVKIEPIVTTSNNYYQNYEIKIFSNGFIIMKYTV